MDREFNNHNGRYRKNQDITRTCWISELIWFIMIGKLYTLPCPGPCRGGKFLKQWILEVARCINERANGGWREWNDMKESMHNWPNELMEPVNQWINESWRSELVNWWINELINQAINESINFANLILQKWSDQFFLHPLKSRAHFAELIFQKCSWTLQLSAFWSAIRALRAANRALPAVSCAFCQPHPPLATVWCTFCRPQCPKVFRNRWFLNILTCKPSSR